MKLSIRDKMSIFFENYRIIIIASLGILAALTVTCISNAPYNSTAVIISIGNEGAVVEYRDRRNILRQDFVELTESHNEGDDITIRIDGWTSSKKEVEK